MTFNLFSNKSSDESIIFIPLSKNHFYLLYKWMNTPHVAKWWSEGRVWNEEAIEEKYSSYVEGYKRVDGKKNPIHAFIIAYDKKPIGYIQYYTVHDFPRAYGYVNTYVPNLPVATAALDFYIGDKQYTGRGLGSKILEVFLKQYICPVYDACYVDPDTANIAAIKTYKKAGFTIVKQDKSITAMLFKRINEHE